MAAAGGAQHGCSICIKAWTLRHTQIWRMVHLRGVSMRIQRA
jgi:hypothetical protein